MAKAPIEMPLDDVAWTPLSGEKQPESALPYATHEGVLKIGDFKLRCYQLNTGQCVFNADDVERFFGGLDVA